VKRSVPEPAPDIALVAERLSKQYRLSRRPALGALSGEPDDVDDDDDDDDDDDFLEGVDDPWEGRVEGSRRAKPQKVWALRDLSFEIRRGSAVGVIGGNGAGKSTLLRVLAGITPPTAGRVVVRGRVAPAVEFASAFLDPTLTGRQNVLLLAQVFGAPRKVAERAMRGIASFAELGPLLDVPAKRYSSGLYRRLAISTALGLEPDILLTDEVFAGGDASFRARCAERLVEERSNGLTIVMASHDPELLRRHCDEGLLLEHGRVTAQGPLEEVLEAYAATQQKRRRKPEAPAAPAAVASREEPAPRPAKKRRSSSADAVLLGGAVFGMDGGALETLRTDEEALLAIAYEVRTPGVEVRCVVALTGDGERVHELVQPAPAPAEDTGSVTAFIHLPAGSLAPGYYTALAGASVRRDGAETTLIAQDAFAFEVYAADGADDLLEEGDADGAFSPDSASWTIVPD
jgi:lipopolysaccharide transport system ATP-binding protein